MGRKDDDETPMRGDRLELDFGKHKLRIEDKDVKPDVAGQVRKLPPEPGRTPPASSVPWSKILNFWKKKQQ